MNRKEPLQVATAVAIAIGLVACGDSGASRFGGGGTGGVGTVGTGTGITGTTSGSYDWQAGIANMVAHGFTVNVALGGSVLVNNSPAAVNGSGVYTFYPA